ncbi:bifunctional 4-hydroxy-3-methylbut-2-enyl diphosphate reductase/30S ribosomal protein S1 [Anaeroselena agilis]|uniref:4-hydroxy-3-methylbut-2-enyl diphosphate reductase n=1 Tax=Anaeroselena agilis TaxID=3063788 RepID=A0ABU3NWM0_9FIRM|nr:bifunctional 4-hydroxy-3-methylbut-2-enyl diphosphate reductase/30S ribosomal protein S1 [Selenomonadales bacterium 4137-cl]
MKILLAEHRGFCYGVERAVAMARGCADRPGKAATLGPIIHNPQLVARLAAEGVGTVDNLDDIKGDTVIIRSHGAPPETYRQAAAKNLTVVDATCPHVRKAQTAARDLREKGYRVAVVGERGHPEVNSIVAWAGDGTVVIETEEEAAGLPAVPRLGIVSQTTFPPGRFDGIVDILKTGAADIQVNKTICTATEQRQQAAVDLAARVDVMVVVGGRGSANTTRLAQLCQEAGSRVYHIETAAELDPEWFRGAEAAGITAGASTPEWVIEEVYRKMQEFDQAMEQEIRQIEKGSIVKGKVVRVSDDEVFVDIGYKAEGVIPLAELAFPQPAKAEEAVKEGDEIDVCVLDDDSSEGAIKLSKVRADSVIAWDKLENAQNSHQPVEGKVTEAVKGGLSVAVFGVRGFIPASQADLRYVEDLSIFAGQTLSVLPIEVDREKKRVVLSRRAVLEEERRRSEAEAFARFQPGQTVHGTVRRLADFGAFVDIGGVDGLIHISDLSWHRVKTASEIVNVGDEVDVVILKLDPATRKISLSLKASQRDPWFDVAETLVVGSVVAGKVTKTSKFGAFVEVAPGVEGLVHISELDDRRVEKAEEVVTAGQEVNVKILGVDKKAKRISLSIAQAKQDRDRAEYSHYIQDSGKGLGFTIGDKLGHLFKRED